MSNHVVRAEYDALGKAASDLAQQADQVAQLASTLCRAEESMRCDWYGEGARAFYKEMECSILPAFGRLERALQEASRVLGKVGNVFQTGEQGGAAILRRLQQAAGSGGQIGQPGAVGGLASAAGLGGLGGTASRAGLGGPAVQFAPGRMSAMAEAGLKNAPASAWGEFQGGQVNVGGAAWKGAGPVAAGAQAGQAGVGGLEWKGASPVAAGAQAGQAGVGGLEWKGSSPIAAGAQVGQAGVGGLEWKGAGMKIDKDWGPAQPSVADVERKVDVAGGAFKGAGGIDWHAGQGGQVNAGAAATHEATGAGGLEWHPGQGGQVNVAGAAWKGAGNVESGAQVGQVDVGGAAGNGAGIVESVAQVGQVNPGGGATVTATGGGGVALHGVQSGAQVAQDNVGGAAWKGAAPPGSSLDDATGDILAKKQ
jgi:WXG100 family type VII secretion target